MTQVPVFKDTVTEIPADWANVVSQLAYGVFGAAGTASGARLAMGLGTLALQNANEVQIAGGSIDNTPIGFTTPANAKFNVAYILDTPVDPLHGVNKAYVDALVASAAGTIISLEELYVAKIGSTMTGPLILSGDPVLANAAATKHYVDQQITIRLASTVNSYQALRQYNGSATAVELVAPLISGLFLIDPNDTSSIDNNGTVIVDTQGRRWKREFTDSVTVEWFGADPTGSNDSEAAFAAAAVLQYPIALREGATYQFGSTLTINGGLFVLRNRATIRLAGGVINNTDASATHFTPLIRLQGMQYVDLGVTTFDHNSLNQVYPATATSFGRGTAPFLHNGAVEITPDVTNTTPSSNVHVEGATFQNCYLNGLVLWQVTNAWVSESQFLNPAMNGISACGVRNVRIYKNQGYRCGVSTGFPASRNGAVHRAAINVQEFPSGITFLSEGIPCIVTGDYVSGGINKYVDISNNHGEQCSTNTVYARAILGLTGGNNRSYNVGFNRPLAAPYRSAHFHFEACEGANKWNQGYQDLVQSTDIQPNGVYAAAMTGASSTFPLAGNYRLDVSGARMHSAKNSSGAPVTGLLYSGLQSSSNVTADYLDIDGVSGDAVDTTNVSTYETAPGVAPHDCSFNNGKFINVAGQPIVIKLTGSPSGVVNNIKAENCTVDAGKEPITFDSSINLTTSTPTNVSYSLGPSDWNVTSENVKGNFNLPFWRTATNTTTGSASLAGFQTVGDTGQSLSMGATGSTYSGGVAAATQAFVVSNAQATGGMIVTSLAGPLNLTAATSMQVRALGGNFSLTATGTGTISFGGNTTFTSSGTLAITAAGQTTVTVNGARAATLFTTGNLRLGTGTSDDGNSLQLAGTLGIASFTTAALPATPNGTPVAFVSDGAKQGETFPGTGIPMYYSNGKWRNFRNDAPSNSGPALTAPLVVGGTWDASANHVNGDTNTSLANGGLQTINTGTSGSPSYNSVSGNGYIYRNTVAGTTSIDGYNQWDVDDLIVCVAGKWVKVTVNFANVVFPAGTF